MGAEEVNHNEIDGGEAIALVEKALDHNRRDDVTNYDLAVAIIETLCGLRSYDDA